MKSDEIVFRGTRDGLQIMLDDESEFDAIKSRLVQRLQSAEYFFRGGDVILDTGRRILTEEQVMALDELSRQHRMRIVKIVSHPDAPHREADLKQHAPVEAVPGDTLLHRRTLRSGQSVEYDGNVVILGDVNPGAEVRAGGDILVMGTVRGVVHAGASGRADAVVVAFRLRPTQIRIGPHIGRPPEEEGAGPALPEVARVRDGAIIVEHLNPA
ncbi:MAG: septum site-determining protein MinC [Bacillota bacterium]